MKAILVAVGMAQDYFHLQDIHTKPCYHYTKDPSSIMHWEPFGEQELLILQSLEIVHWTNRPTCGDGVAW